MPLRLARAPLAEAAAAVLPAVLAASLLVGCGGGSTEPPAVATVEVTAASATLAIGPAGGQTRQLTAVTKRASGATLVGRLVTWGTQAPTVASVSAAGVVTALGVGSAVITATSEGKVGTYTVFVEPVSVSTVALTPVSPATFVGATLQLIAEPRDSLGNALLGRAVAWASLDTARATVSTLGLVTGRSVGAVSITATSEGRIGSISVTVQAAAGPVLSNVAPSTLVPGSVATLNGTGFDASPANNTLRVGTSTVPVLAASPTALTFVVPCLNSGTVPIQVTSPGGPGSVLNAPLAVTQRALAVGEALVLQTDTESACNELVNTGGSPRYLIAAFSVGTTANTLIDLELAGNPPPSAIAAERARVITAPSAVAPVFDREQAARDRAHFEHLERERALYASLRAQGLDRVPPKRADRPRLVAPPLVGEMRSIHFTFTSGCSDSTNIIRARAIRVGTRAVVWEDSANAIVAANVPELATALNRMGEVFDRDQYEAVRTYFGDPLRRDLDDDGLLHMVFTQKLNGSGAAAYVTSCDMVVRGPTTGGGNYGEYFYGIVPTTATPNVNSTASPDGWFAFMSRTVVHEVKHIASLSARFANGAPQFESPWLEEGTARHAEEVWVRDSVHRVPWKANTGYGSAATNGVFCDFNLGNSTCTAADPFRRPTWGLRRQLNEILPKLQDPAGWSPFGDGTGQSGSVFYNTTWSFVRWAADRYGTSDAAFLTALTQSSTNGLTNLSGVTGASASQLLGAWGLALMADDYPGLVGASADVQFPTWNLRNIYAGLNADPAWAGRFTTSYPVVTTPVGFGSFSVVRAGVRGGAHLMVELSGVQAAPQLLNLRAPGGAAMSPFGRLAIVRVQ